MNADTDQKRLDQSSLQSTTSATLSASASGKPDTEDNKDNQVTAVIERVGRRVRAARKEAGFSRRVLSEISGVSQRYLALLESGAGNISIGLLKQLALALERPIEFFLMEDDPLTTEASQIASMYRSADADTRVRVQQILNPQVGRQQKAQRICLLGLRGAGKSALGALTGESFELEFLELNNQIERAAGIPVAEIIALYGPEGYRELEAECLNRIIESKDRLLLAVAGGVVLNTDTFSTLLRRFNSVWIKASPDEHMERVRAQGDMRPMADNPQAMVQLRQILKSREAMYRQADYCIDTSGKTLAESHSDITRLVSSEHLLNV